MAEITIAELTGATDRAAEELAGLMRQLTTDPELVTVGRLREILAAGTRIIVAREGERIVGTASVVPMRQMRADKGWLEDLVVDEAYRGQGIARRLLDEAVRVGWELGCANLNMTSRPGREAAQRLYESAGFARRDTYLFRLTRP